MSALQPTTPPAAASGWSERWDRQVDRWMTSPALGRWAGRSVLTRWLVKRRSRQLFDLMAGFVHSQVLLGCVRLQLFERLAERPHTLDEIAQRDRIPPAHLQRLLDSAVALQLLERRGARRYGLGPLGAPLAVHAGIRDMVEHNATLYRDLHDPLALLRDPDGAQMHAWWPYTDHQDGSAQATAPADQFARYSSLMASSQRFVIDEMLDSHDFGRHQRVLDVGGGLGGWVSALARHYPALSLMHMDLPPVSQLARQRIADQGLTGRIECHPGSFLHDPLPRGADLVTLVRVAHDHPDAAVRHLLRAIHDALPEGGELLLAEPMAEVDGQPATPDPYFHFYLLAMGSGRLRTPAELMRLMTEAGFEDVQRLPGHQPVHAALLLGRKTRCLPLGTGTSVNKE